MTFPNIILVFQDMSAIHLAAEGRDYLMWCPDSEFDRTVATLDMRVSVRCFSALMPHMHDFNLRRLPEVRSGHPRLISEQSPFDGRSPQVAQVKAISFSLGPFFASSTFHFPQSFGEESSLTKLPRTIFNTFKLKHELLLL